MKEASERIASEIYNDFYLYSAHQNSVKVRKEQAKSLSLKCVDRIIGVIPMYTGILNPTWKLYTEVRKTLEKL